MSLRSLATFGVLVFAPSWGIQFAVLYLVGDFQSGSALPFAIATMFMPALVSAGFMIFMPSTRVGVLWRPTWKAGPLIVVGALVPAAVTFAMVAIVHALGWAQSGWFVFSPEAVTVSGGPWLLGRGAQGWAYFTANVAATAVAYSVIATSVTVGEEFGWRAFLQTKLIDRFGMTMGIVILGAAWSMWHLPAQLFAGYNFPDHPVVGSLVISPVMLIGISFFLGWLTIAARSFWPAAVAHGAYNSIYAGVNWNLQPSVPRLYIDLVTCALIVAVGAICWAALRMRTAAGPGSEIDRDRLSPAAEA